MQVVTVIFEDLGALDDSVVETATRAVSQWQHRPIGLDQHRQGHLCSKTPEAEFPQAIKKTGDIRQTQL
jgi:hypothetical protein